MKRISAIIVAFCMLIVLALPAFAEISGNQTVTLTIGERTPTWTLLIPASQEIEENAEETDLSTASISGVKFLGDDQTITVTLRHTSVFVNADDDSQLLSFSLHKKTNGNIPADEDYAYGTYTNAAGFNADEFAIMIDQSDWEAAVPGDYSTVIVYGSSVS